MATSTPHRSLDADDVEKGADLARLKNDVVENFSWEDVTVSVKDRKTKMAVNILEGVSGFVEAGMLVEGIVSMGDSRLICDRGDGCSDGTKVGSSCIFKFSWIIANAKFQWFWQDNSPECTRAQSRDSKRYHPANPLHQRRANLTRKLPQTQLVR